MPGSELRGDSDGSVFEKSTCKTTGEDKVPYAVTRSRTSAGSWRELLGAEWVGQPCRQKEAF